jgi:hypothetical protein
MFMTRQMTPPMVRLVAQSGYLVAMCSFPTCGTAMTTAGLTEAISKAWMSSNR